MYISQTNTNPVSSAPASSAPFDTVVAHRSQNMPGRTAALQTGAHTPASLNNSGTTSPAPAYSSVEYNSVSATPAPAYRSPAPAYHSGAATPAQPLAAYTPEGSRGTDIELNHTNAEDAAPATALPNEADLERGEANTSRSAATATVQREHRSIKKPLIKIAISAGLMGAGIYGVVNGAQRIARG